jgi:NTE family protein
MEVLGRKRGSPFEIFAGTSVGAINSTFLAANSDRPDLGVDDLRKLWDLDIHEHLKVDPLGLFQAPKKFADRVRRLVGRPLPERGIGRSILDVRPLEKLVRRGIDFGRLHHNISGEKASALAIAALEIASGRTTIFIEHGEQTFFSGTMDPRRQPKSEEISADHVLGSCALPLLYPARRIGERYYVDGGIRFNTPIAPAIRTGADRIVVIAPSSPPAAGAPINPSRDYPSLPFLLGKLVNALLLDPLTYDLAVLDRFNALFDILNQTLPRDVMDDVSQLLFAGRGAAYRKIDTLVFRPSQDMSAMASHYVENELNTASLGSLRRWLLGKATRTRVAASDLASYLLFDGGFTRKLIDLGHEDAVLRADEIREFFAR